MCSGIQVFRIGKIKSNPVFVGPEYLNTQAHEYLNA
jgi:hypothetical protein